MVETAGLKLSSSINKRKEIPGGEGNWFYEVLSEGRAVNCPSLGFKTSTLGTMTYKNRDFNERWSAIKATERKKYEAK
jgi:hypothetical protein